MTMATDTDFGGRASPGTDKDRRLKENKKGAADEATEDLAPDGLKPCPPGFEPDPKTGKCVPEDEAPGAPEEDTADTATLASEGDPVEPVEPTEPATTAPWTGVLVVEGVTTGDGREFAPNSLTWADLPLPLRWNKEDSHGGIPHTVAVNVGRIDVIWRDEDKIMGSGVLNLAEADGKRAYDLIKGKFLRGVSIDADDIGDADIEYVWPEKNSDDDSEIVEADDILSILFGTPEKTIFHAGRVRAATLCDVAAFVEAYVAIDEDAQVALAASATRVAQSGTDDTEAAVGPWANSLVAHAVSDEWRPDRSWFENPNFSVLVPVTITDAGRVYGHAAPHGECHVGYTNECVSIPYEAEYPYFMTGEVICSDGTHVSVGQITVNTNHAPLYMGASGASDHYDNTGAAVADVAVGTDNHGIWFAGALRPDTTASQIHALRASGNLSGDWRRIGGSLRLIGLLAVNAGGYPIPRLHARVASGAPQALISSGLPTITGHTKQELDQKMMLELKASLVRRVMNGSNSEKAVK